MELKDLKLNQMTLLELADRLKNVYLQLEHLKTNLEWSDPDYVNEKVINLNLGTRHKTRFPYGCYDPRQGWQYRYRCSSCREYVSPVKKYKATTESAGYIFICPNCRTPDFAYQYNVSQTDGARL